MKLSIKKVTSTLAVIMLVVCTSLSTSLAWNPVNQVIAEPGATYGRYFTVGAYGVSIPNDVPVDHVNFACWSEANGQDDLIWSRGYRYSGPAGFDNGDFWFTFDIGDHSFERGIYSVHVYAVGTDGNSYGIGSTTVNVRGADHGMGNVSNMVATDALGQNNGSSFNVFAYGVNINGDPSKVVRVNFAVWTEANGQDDLKWIAGERFNGASNMSNADYRLAVNRSDHNYETGNYIVHAYAVDENNNSHFLGGVDVYVGYNGGHHV